MKLPFFGKSDTERSLEANLESARKQEAIAKDGLDKPIPEGSNEDQIRQDRQTDFQARREAREAIEARLASHREGLRVATGRLGVVVSAVIGLLTVLVTLLVGADLVDLVEDDGEDELIIVSRWTERFEAGPGWVQLTTLECTSSGSQPCRFLLGLAGSGSGIVQVYVPRECFGAAYVGLDWHAVGRKEACGGPGSDDDASEDATTTDVIPPSTVLPTPQQ
jgi:hypothetical protein